MHRPKVQLSEDRLYPSYLHPLRMLHVSLAGACISAWREESAHHLRRLASQRDQSQEYTHLNVL